MRFLLACAFICSIQSKPEQQGPALDAARRAQDEGAFAQAASAYNAILIRWPNLFSDDPDTYFHSKAGLAFNLFSQGHTEQAEFHYRQALELARQTHHPRISELVEGLAIVLGRRGQVQQARTLFREALKQRQQQLGYHHRRSMITRNNFAELLLANGRHGEAEQLLARDREHIASLEQTTDPLVLALFHNLALAWYQSGKHRQAESLSLKVWQERRRVLGLSHAETLLSANNHATFLAAVQGPEPAMKFLRQNLAELVGKANQDQVLLLQHSLGHQLMKAGRNEEAQTLLLETWQARSTLLGASHPASLRTRVTIAENLQASGSPQDAEAIFSEVVTQAEGILPANNRDLRHYRKLRDLCRRQLKEGK